MFKHKIAAFVAALILALGGVFIPATPAQAAITGCSTGQRSKVERGIVSYQGWVVCYGTPPKGKKYYRAKIIYSFLGTGVFDMPPSYGQWERWGNGRKSSGKWVAWPYRSNEEGRQLQVK